MKKEDKRAISPVIASVLLVAMAIILALIVFLWAQSFIQETITKNGEVVENWCGQVSFDADLALGELTVVNRGQISLYGVAVRKTGAGEETTCYPLESATVPTIRAGESKGGISLSSCNLDSGDSVTVIPVILGETENGQRKFYTCDSSFGKEKVYAG